MKLDLMMHVYSIACTGRVTAEMRKRIAAIIVPVLAGLVVSASTASAQPQGDVSGAWYGEISITGNPLAVTVRLDRSDDGRWGGEVDIPAQGARAVPLVNVSVDLPQVSFTIDGPPGDPTFDGRLSEDGSRITGNFTQSGISFAFRLSRSESDGGEAAARVDEQMLEALRGTIRRTMEEWHVPGLAVAIVSNGSVILSEGFGRRDVRRERDVDAETVFPIGSATKAFTATLVGTLVEDGLLEWDDPVVKHLPEFRLADEYATTHLSVRDLLTHTSGLPRHDMVWYGSTFSRRELFERLRYLEPSAELRQQRQYQNLMYMTAGILAERVTGKSWEELIRERIFDPLEFDRAGLSVADLENASNAALGYGYDLERSMLEPMKYRNLDAIAPAGGINASIEEMGRWVLLQLEGGRRGGSQVISRSMLAQIHRPQVLLGDESPLVREQLFSMYAMGWWVHSYRGHRLLQHGGNIDGFTSMVSFLPDDNLGVVILANQNASPLPTLLMYTIYDRMLGLDEIAWNERFIAQRDAMQKTRQQAESDERLHERIGGTQPSHPLEDFAGTYAHPAYGQIRIERSNGGLEAHFHGETFLLEHYHYDVFRANDAGGAFDALKVQFRGDLHGSVAELEVPFEPATGSIVFTRKPSEALFEPSALAAFEGTYAIAGQSMIVALRGKRLYLSVPGQGDFELIPEDTDRFSVPSLPGYFVRFERTDGDVRRMVLLQPNGTFVAERR